MPCDLEFAVVDIAVVAAAQAAWASEHRPAVDIQHSFELVSADETVAAELFGLDTYH
jgi:hypothetical protein